MVRELTVEEIKLAPPLGQEFYATGAIPGKLIPEVFTLSWTRFYAADFGRIFGLFNGDELVGVLGGILYPDSNDGVLVATEMFWFVASKHRGTVGSLRLFDAYEKWAKERGAGRIAMIHLQALAPETLEKLYLRKGYRKLESHYVKTL